MKKTFYYTRISNSGRPYQVEFTIVVTPDGYASIPDAEFSLREILVNCLTEVTEFVKQAMAEYHLGVAEFKGRVNRGHPTAPINRGGRYYAVDGKLYRCDKQLGWMGWTAPASDLYRILIALGEGKGSDGGSFSI